MDETQTEIMDAVSFVGHILAPFYLEDPVKGTASDLFTAMAALDVDAAAQEWPFVGQSEVYEMLSLMVKGLKDGTTDDLVWEYRRLFVGPNPKPCPPWGSVYTDRECVIFGASTLKLRFWMRENGFERLSDEKTPEDHIGLMLSLMAAIAEQRPDKLEEYLSRHLLTWSKHFLDQMAESSNHSFYKGLALLTNATLEGLKDELSLEVVYPRFYR